jgi:tetratricopeptide (TPR) repeat protein
MGGRREEAIALYQQYLDSGHGARDADARNHMASLQTTATGDETADTEAARTIFQHGSALYDQGDFAHAYDEFTRAGELAARPGILFSRAQALRRLGGREAEASALYEQYVASGDGSRTEDAERMLELLRTHGSGV